VSLGLGSNLTKSGIVTPGIVTDNLVLKHKYDATSVVPISDGAVNLIASDGDYISTGFVADYISTNATVAFWVNMKDFSGTQTLGQHNEKRWYMGFDTTNGVIGVANSYATISISPTPVVGEWIHYCVTAIGGTATLYINGVAQGTDSYTQSSATDPETGFFIGARANPGAGNHMNGYICNVGQWSTGLTQAQIKSIMNKNYEGLSDSEKTMLEAWWNLSADANDSHGSSNGTLT